MELVSIELNSLFYPRRFFSEYLGIKIGAKATAAGTAIATQGKKIIEGVKSATSMLTMAVFLLGRQSYECFRAITVHGYQIIRTAILRFIRILVLICRLAHRKVCSGIIGTA